MLGFTESRDTIIIVEVKYNVFDLSVVKQLRRYRDAIRRKSWCRSTKVIKMILVLYIDKTLLFFSVT